MNEQAIVSNGKAEKKVLIAMIDTTKAGLKAYLEDAGETLKCKPESGKAMRLAVFRFVLDSAKVEDKEVRNQAWKQFEATHSSFGCNASASRQNVLGLKAAPNIFESGEFDA